MTDKTPEGIDTSGLSEEEKLHLKKYGKLKKTVGVKKEKKYFDSADWQMGAGGQGQAAQKPGGPLRPGGKKPPLPDSVKKDVQADDEGEADEDSN